MGDGPKQLLPFGDGTILGTIIGKLRAAGFGPLLVVAGGPHREEVAEAADRMSAVVVENHAPEPGGMITSVRCGIETLIKMNGFEVRVIEAGKRRAGSAFPGFLLHPSDYPAIGSDTYEIIFSTVKMDPGKIVIPVASMAGTEKQVMDEHSAGRRNTTGEAGGPTVSRRGHPAWFPAGLVAEIMNPSENDLRAVSRRRPGMVKELPVSDRGITTDLNTPEKYRKCFREAIRRPPGF